MKLQATVLHPGHCTGKVLLLDQALSFWGGFDPAEGRIIDIHHPQAGQCVADRVLVMSETRGSAGTPAGLAEAIRLGVGPLAMIMNKVDLNVVAGAMVAQRLYQVNIPVLQLGKYDFTRLRTEQILSLTQDGVIEVDASD